LYPRMGEGISSEWMRDRFEWPGDNGDSMISIVHEHSRRSEWFMLAQFMCNCGGMTRHCRKLSAGDWVYFNDNWALRLTRRVTRNLEILIPSSGNNLVFHAKRMAKFGGSGEVVSSVIRSARSNLRSIAHVQLRTPREMRLDCANDE
jgi:hypothetical protein